MELDDIYFLGQAIHIFRTTHDLAKDVWKNNWWACRSLEGSVQRRKNPSILY
ncbi:MAG: hypothetical protein ACTSP7_13715 [Candidatus Heimdallarchaeota archaeon]